MEPCACFRKRWFSQFLISVSAFIILSFGSFADIPPKNIFISDTDIVTDELSFKSDEPMGDFQSLTIPLKRAGNLFLIETRIDGQEGNLIFDTGASGLVLNKTYFRKYAATEKTAGGGVTGQFDKIYRIVVKRIDIAELYYEETAADLADLGHIENRRGIKVLGLLGINMINNFEVIFDANNSELQLHRIDKQGNRLSATAMELKFDFTQKMETHNNIMLIKAKIGDKMLNFCLDTGAETNVISNDVSKKVMNTIVINRRSNLSGASGSRVDVLYGTMKDFELGTQKFNDMETVIINLSGMSESYGCSIDGMLGFDFWQKGIFCFNFGKKEMSFSAGKGDKK